MSMKTKELRGSSEKNLACHRNLEVAIRRQAALLAPRWTISEQAGRSQAMHSSKLTERSWNVYENKGSAREEREEAGMPQKTKGSYVSVDCILWFNIGK